METGSTLFCSLKGLHHLVLCWGIGISNDCGWALYGEPSHHPCFLQHRLLSTALGCGDQHRLKRVPRTELPHQSLHYCPPSSIQAHWVRSDWQERTVYPNAQQPLPPAPEGFLEALHVSIDLACLCLACLSDLMASTTAECHMAVGQSFLYHLLLSLSFPDQNQLS